MAACDLNGQQSNHCGKGKGTDVPLSTPPSGAPSFQRFPSCALNMYLRIYVELGGVVTEEQCRTLADYLSPSVGGQYLIPQACSKLLNVGDDAEREKGREDGYGRLKRRPTVIAKEAFPPTMC